MSRILSASALAEILGHITALRDAVQASGAEVSVCIGPIGVGGGPGAAVVFSGDVVPRDVDATYVSRLASVDVDVAHAADLSYS
jgi:hypothetical protein